MKKKNKNKKLYLLFLLLPLLVLPITALLIKDGDEDITTSVVDLYPFKAESYLFNEIGETATFRLKEAKSAFYTWHETDNKEYSECFTIEEVQPLLYEISILQPFSNQNFIFEIYNESQSQLYILSLNFIEILADNISLDTSEVIF